MTVRFIAEAKGELREAMDYYNGERPGLGYEFLAEVKNAVQRIQKYPEAWPIVEEDLRKCLLNKFPFSLVYHPGNDGAIIIALMHARRKPGYWKNRPVQS